MRRYRSTCSPSRDTSGSRWVMPAASPKDCRLGACSTLVGWAREREVPREVVRAVMMPTRPTRPRRQPDTLTLFRVSFRRIFISANPRSGVDHSVLGSSGILVPKRVLDGRLRHLFVVTIRRDGL